MSLLADKKQALKRAIRSKDFETLLSYIPYDIPVVDSLLQQAKLILPPQVIRKAAFGTIEESKR